MSDNNTDPVFRLTKEEFLQEAHDEAFSLKEKVSGIKALGFITVAQMVSKTLFSSEEEETFRLEDISKATFTVQKGNELIRWMFDDAIFMIQAITFMCNVIKKHLVG